MSVLAATSSTVATGFIELGAVALLLALLARVAARVGMTTIPFYLVAGLALGEGGIAPLDVSHEFIRVVAEIGVLLLLFALGLEYNASELRRGLADGLVPGLVDAASNFAPGFVAGVLLGWGWTPAVLLGGVTWVTSSGIVAKVTDDLGWRGRRELPAVLNLLVIEDLAMAVFLPVAAALVLDRDVADTAITIAVAVVAATAILVAALRLGDRLSAVLSKGTDEALLLSVFGLTLLVGGLAQKLEVSAAIGAFLVGLALSGTVQSRAASVISPLRDLFAAVFFLFFSFQIDPGDLVDFLVLAVILAVVAIGGKFFTGAFAAGRVGADQPGRRRAGALLAARGEFSVVIASLGTSAAHGGDLGALAAAFVLVTAIAGPVLARVVDRAGATSDSA